MGRLKLLQTSVTSSVLLISGLLVPSISFAELSGNIGVHSKYLLRGIFEENDDAAVQGGLDYSNDSGLYAGWWISSLGYTYEAPANTKTNERGVENNLYGGFTGEMGSIGYDIGLIQYLYVNVDDSDLTELKAALSLGPLYLQLQYLLNDGWWGNAGDIYWTAGASFDLPHDFGFAIDLGYYTYEDDDNAELSGCNGVTPCNVTTDDSGFRHANFTLSHPVGSTGADMYVQYTLAGEDRSGTDYDDSMVIGFTYEFDI